MNDLYFSVVIPTFNRLPVLEKVLSAFNGQTNPPPFEVILIDDGSSDATASRIEGNLSDGLYRFLLRFETQSNSGPGKARNRGVSLATGRFVVLIGDDTVPRHDFLAEHARIHRQTSDDPRVACLGYTGWPPGQRVTAFMDYINDYGLQFGYKLIKDGAAVPFNFFYTSNLSIDRILLRDHPFDASFPAAAWEDIELAYRLDAEGLRILYNASARTDHHHPMTVDSFARRQYVVGKSGAIFHQKHPELDHFLGVPESRTRPAPSERTMSRLRRRAHLGERFRFLARDAAFEQLMREHYLQGLRDGLRELEPED